MSQIIFSSVFTSFARQPHEPVKDTAEMVADACLFLPRTAFGDTYDLNMQEVPTAVITRIATAIILVVGILLTAPLALVGIYAASRSETYNPLLARYHLEPPMILQATNDAIKEIFNHVLRWAPEDTFPELLLYGLHDHFTHRIGQNLMEVLEPHPTYVAALAQASADNVPKKPDPNIRKLAAHQIILHCQTLDQFEHFIKAIQDNDEKMDSCIEMMLNFFYDDRLVQSDKDFFHQRFHSLADTLGEEVLADYIFNGKGLHKKLLEKQLQALSIIFPSGPIYERAAAKNLEAS